jgi:hypothetical protein
MQQKLILPKDFKEFIALLNKNDVQYLVVGGYALAVYGHPRFTGDIDIWIQTNNDNASKLIATLSEFGFSSIKLEPSDLITPNQVIQLGYPPLRIDILTSLDGIKFDNAYSNVNNVEVDNLSINFISKSDLITNKKASSRYQDLADLEKLE